LVLEPDSFEAVSRHLPEAVRPVALFAFITGWRVCEILGLTWRQVDFGASTVRLEPGTTKNDTRLVLIVPLLGLGELERWLTSLQEAQQLAEATAKTMYREMGMTYWHCCRADLRSASGKDRANVAGYGER
jgi:integrase